MPQRKITAIRSVGHWDGAMRPKRLADDQTLSQASGLVNEMARAGFVMALVASEDETQPGLPSRTLH